MKIIDKFLEKKIAQIDATNPDKIKVEDISNFFFIPKFVAKFFLEMGVKQKYFKRFKENSITYYKLMK